MRHFCTSSNWRGGSSRATKRKQKQKNGLQSLKNLRLPDHLQSLAPLIPMLNDMLSQYKPIKKLKPKKQKTSSLAKQPEKRIVQLRSTEPCWYHLNGGCRFGDDKSHFSHDKRRPSPQKTSGLNKTDKPNQQHDKALSKAWDLRPTYWDGEIFSIAGFSNKLDCLNHEEELEAVVKVDHEYDLQELREMLPNPLNDKIKILAVQPCMNPQLAAAELHEIAYAPVRSGAIMTPRALILHRVTSNCDFGLEVDKTKVL